MEMFTMCMECVKELGHPSFEPFFVPYYDDLVCDVRVDRERDTPTKSQV